MGVGIARSRALMSVDSIVGESIQLVEERAEGRVVAASRLLLRSLSSLSSLLPLLFSSRSLSLSPSVVAFWSPCNMSLSAFINTFSGKSRPVVFAEFVLGALLKPAAPKIWVL